MTYGSHSNGQLSAVRRQLGTRELEAGEAKVLTISQVYDANLEDVWDALTNAERLPRWFLPISGELKVGGHYQLEGHAGGTVEACTPPGSPADGASFAATWEYGGAVSWIEVHLRPEPAGHIRVVLDHIAFADDHWALYGPGAVGIGWDLLLVSFATHLASAVPTDPAQAAAWSESAEGIAFITRSGHLWRQADVAAGEDPAAAAARSERTIAFYTAVPEA